MKNILVTGGAGFIGSHTVVELINSGYRPVIIDDFSNSQPSVIKKLEQLTKNKIVCYSHQYQDAKKLEDIIKNESIDGVIHFAAFKATTESVQNPLKYYRNNVAGLTVLLEALAKTGVPNLVFSSSATVYGEAAKLPITEDSSAQSANSPYGRTKRMCEMILEDVTPKSKSLRCMSLRYFNPVGAHPSALIGELPIGTPANLIPFLTQAAAGVRGALTLYGDDYDTPDGTCIRDYIHVVDLAKAHINALEHLAKQSAGSYDFCNIGTGHGSSVLEVINTFEKVTGTKVPHKIGPRREGDVPVVYASVDKAKKLLGWKAELSLADALKDAWRWQKTL